ncbi:MAG: hypothetical protein ACYCQI_03060 [Gammaproteobacteria bacterium]
MDGREEKNITQLQLPEDVICQVESLGGSKIVVRQMYTKENILVFELLGTEFNLIAELKHEDCSNFCVSHDKTRVVTASTKKLCVWEVQEDKIILNKEIDISKEEFREISQIILCKDNTHLVGSDIFSRSIFMYNLSTGRVFHEKDYRHVDISLLEKGDISELFCWQDKNILGLAIDFAAEVIKKTAVKIPGFESCVISPGNEYMVLINRDRDAHHLVIYDINSDLTLTNGRVLNYFLASGSNNLIFVDDHTIAFVVENEPYAFAWYPADVFQVDLRSPKLNPVKCFSLATGERGLQNVSYPLCHIAGGFLEIVGNRCARIYTHPSYQLLEQAEAAIFDYYLYGTLPMSTQISSMVARYVGYSLPKSSNLFAYEGQEASIQKPQRIFLNSLLEKLISTNLFSAEDNLALKSFLAASSNPDKPLAECKDIALKSVAHSGKGSQTGITDRLFEFFKKIEKLDKLEKDQLKRKSERGI